MEKINFCIKCGMPDTRPGSNFIDGVCGACRNYEKIKLINWEERMKLLVRYADKYRKNNGDYDMIIPVSGGKDSHTIVYYMTQKLGMNPLLVNVSDPFTQSKAGANNLRNLNDTFNCDLFIFKMGIDTFRRATRIAFEQTGEVLKFIETAIYTVPFKLMVEFDIPFMVFGEDSGFIYGTKENDEPCANGTILGMFDSFDKDFWLSHGLKQNEINCCLKPDVDKMHLVKPEVLWMSYFIPWDCDSNLQVARRYGFQDLYHEWQREGYHDHYQQIDSIAYMIHHWMKYPKFGFNRTVDIAGRDVREGRISLDEAKKLTKDQWKVDQRAVDDFCKLCGYTRKEFWSIVDRHWNRDIVEKHYFKE